MKGNFHVQFLGEGVAATSPPYPTLGWATTQVYPARITRAGFSEQQQFCFSLKTEPLRKSGPELTRWHDKTPRPP